MAYQKQDSDKVDTYQLITNKFLDAFLNGTPPWKKLWTMDLPSNPSSKTIYSGMNRLLLMMEASDKGYQSNEWLTWNQKEQLGLKLLPKQKMTPITKFGVYVKEKCDDGKERYIEIKQTDPRYKDDRLEKKTFMKTFYVFNLAQFQDFVPKQTATETFKIDVAEEMVQAMVEKANIDIRHGANQAYYESVNDYIHIPHKHFFTVPEDYYATLFHEGAHATMHESRLNREEARGNMFGSSAYAKEELRAEIASVFINSMVGVQFDDSHFENHAAYINSWIKILQEDKKEIFRAANDAQKIANYYQERLNEYRQEQSNSQTTVSIQSKDAGLSMH